MQIADFSLQTSSQRSDRPAFVRKRPVRNRWRAVFLASIALLVFSTVRLPAAQIEGVTFADRHQAGGIDLQLNCVGLLRYKVVFKGYVAGLYLPAGEPPERALDDVPKRLELSYFWSIDGADFGKAGNQVLSRNVDAETMAGLRSRLDQIDSMYQDVKPGDRYALTYVPGSGTELALNGERKGVIPGADFARAYFAIWLGTDPIDASLKHQLLTCS